MALSRGERLSKHNTTNTTTPRELDGGRGGGRGGGRSGVIAIAPGLH